MSSRKEKWFMIESSNGGYEVVNYRAVASGEMRIGSMVTINKPNGEQDTATIIGSSRDRQVLEQQVAPAPRLYEDNMDTTSTQNAGPSMKHEVGDFSASDESDWAPSDEHSTDEDDADIEVENKLKRISRSYSNKRTSKIIKPCHRVEAVVTSLSNNRKRRHEKTVKLYQKPKSYQKESNRDTEMKSLPDSTRKNNSPAPNITEQFNGQNDNILTHNAGAVAINVQDILNMKQCFDELFKLLSELNPSQNSMAKEKEIEPAAPLEIIRTESLAKPPAVKSEKSVVQNITQDFDEYDFQSDESQRSDDNVLITNKYDTVRNQITNGEEIVRKRRNTREKNTCQKKENRITDAEEQTVESRNGQEWIPIGSGKTLMHKDQYRKVNWKSYTIATRTLLLALFPRRILATHSMTGKRSPAFQDKPAKMCLDPKIVSDVIIEITERFKVKENLVRSIITTKCADECKMLKMRMKRKTLPNNQENLSPNGSDDIANQTC